MKLLGLYISIITLSLVPLNSSSGIQTNEWKGSIEQVDGVTVVKNPKNPIYAEKLCEINEELRIGEAEGEEEYMFQAIGSIAVDEAERIYISDRKESCIKVFDQRGKYIRTIGRKGQGPGEFQSVTRIQILPNNDLLIYDGNIRRLSLFTFNGIYKSSKSISTIPALDLRINSQGLSLVNTVQLNPQSAQAVTSIGIYDQDFNLLKTIITSDPKDVQTPFLPFNVWTILHDDSILIGNNESYELKIFDFQGNLIKKITKDYTPIKITEAEKRESLKKLEQPMNKKVPEFHPAFRSITDDEKGRLFVETWEQIESREGHIYNIHDEQGKFISTIVLKFSPQVWKKGELYTIEEDEDGYPNVKRYKVTWKI